MCRSQNNTIQWIVVLGLLLVLIGTAGCAPGMMDHGARIENNFYVNAMPDESKPAAAMKARALGAGNGTTDSGQTVTPTATTTSQVSSDHGSVTITIRQGTSEATTAAGLSASIPAAGM